MTPGIYEADASLCPPGYRHVVWRDRRGVAAHLQVREDLADVVHAMLERLHAAAHLSVAPAPAVPHPCPALQLVRGSRA